MEAAPSQGINTQSMTRSWRAVRKYHRSTRRKPYARLKATGDAAVYTDLCNSIDKCNQLNGVRRLLGWQDRDEHSEKATQHPSKSMISR